MQVPTMCAMLSKQNGSQPTVFYLVSQIQPPTPNSKIMDGMFGEVVGSTPAWNIYLYGLQILQGLGVCSCELRIYTKK